MLRFHHCAFLLALAVLGPSTTVVVAQDTLADTLSSDPELSVLTQALTTASLVESLSDAMADPVTVFAPTDDAFAALPDGVSLDDLLSENYVNHLINLLTMHVVSGEVGSGDLMDGQEVEAENGEILSVAVDVTDGTTTVSISSPNTTSSTVVEPDIQASNGVAHKVDSVLLPAFFGLKLTDLPQTQEDFSILTEFFELSGVAALIPEGFPGTVFAPVDTAFDAVGQDVLDFYRTNTSGLLNILATHVIKGVEPTQVFTQNTTHDTLLRVATLQITIEEDGDGTPTYFVANTAFPDLPPAQIIRSNILASNGVVHAIDRILVEPPPNLGTPAPTLSPAAGEATAPDVVSGAAATTRRAVWTTLLSFAAIAVVVVCN